MRDSESTRVERRSFIKCMAAGLTALPFGVATTEPFHAQVSGSVPQPADGWGSRVGFALFTVRDLLVKDREGTMAAVAAMGIKEVQPRTYLDLDHGAFRALLDRHGLTCHSTHEFSIPGPGLERDLESLQKIGIKYARFPLPGEPIPGTRRGGDTGNAPAPASQGRGRGRGGGGATTMVETPDMMRRTAEDLNKNGRLAAKYGIKALYHNHTTEFQRYPGERHLPYEILLRETDPALVAMEIDLGWAAVAGADIDGLFKQHPGRFELWHVKDAIGIKHLTPAMNQLERRAAVTLMPVGLGEVDYRAIFSAAGVAGLRHYYIEQDNAAAWGDAMAATRVSVNNLRHLLPAASR